VSRKTRIMKKTAYFGSDLSDRWPTPAELEHYFLAPPGERFFDIDNDTAGLHVKGLNGTEHLEVGKGRIDVSLSLCGHPDHGVLLFYTKWDGRQGGAYASKGDLSRLGDWVETYHEDLRPIGLFVSCAWAWKAVKEFIETDGDLPKCIEWIPADDLPAYAFPEPGTVPRDHPNIQRRA
jgi:hypothetical protein